jgi:hypothetical protein
MLVDGASRKEVGQTPRCGSLVTGEPRRGWARRGIEMKLSRPAIVAAVAVFTATLDVPPSLAGNCSISNGVASGDCGPMKFLEVAGSERVDKVVPGARVRSGGSLNVSGMVTGDVTVERGGYAVIRGQVNGSVVNNGGMVGIHGMANRVQANGGETTIHGMVQSIRGSGTVRYKAGAIVGGVRVERDR